MEKHHTCWASTPACPCKRQTARPRVPRRSAGHWPGPCTPPSCRTSSATASSRSWSPALPPSGRCTSPRRSGSADSCPTSAGPECCSYARRGVRIRVPLRRPPARGRLVGKRSALGADWPGGRIRGPGRRCWAQWWRSAASHRTDTVSGWSAGRDSRGRTSRCGRWTRRDTSPRQSEKNAKSTESPQGLTRAGNEHWISLTAIHVGRGGIFSFLEIKNQPVPKLEDWSFCDDFTLYAFPGEFATIVAVTEVTVSAAEQIPGSIPPRAFFLFFPQLWKGLIERKRCFFLESILQSTI